MPPPIVPMIIDRFESGHKGLNVGPLEDTAADPARAARMEYVGGHDQSSNPVLNRPVFCRHNVLPGISTFMAHLDDSRFGQALFQEYFVNQVSLAFLHPNFLCREQADINDQDSPTAAGVKQARGFKSPILKTPTEHEDGIGLLDRLIDDPKLGQFRQDGSAEGVAEGQEQSAQSGEDRQAL